MLSNKDNFRISKLLSYVLRHKPEEIGIALDAEGWVNVDILLQKLHAYGEPVSEADLKHVVDTNNKKRFAFSDDGTKIRASQGHSVEVELGYTPKEPPEFLYHGTVAAFIEPIKADGLKKMNRHHVHLSADIETAAKVGQRRGAPVILKIMAHKMYAEGYPFFISDNLVWLTETVAPSYIIFA